jgi:L-iditol 2-dehydrogenase
MRAIVFHKKNDLRLEDICITPPDENQVVVKVSACGVCGTDIHIYEGAEGSAKVAPPLVLGHEFSGVVCETGSRVKTVSEGDRVCVDPNDMCGICYYCRRGLAKFCENHIGMGTTVNGAFAEYITVREKQVYKIPDYLSFEEAALVEPLSCCLNGIDLTEIKAGDNVLIIGGGTIGLMMLQLARNNGAGRIILSEPMPAKRLLALKLGADAVLDVINERIDEIIHESGIKEFNKVIECVGAKNTMEEAIRSAGRGSTVMLFGLSAPSVEIAVKPYEIFRKELAVKASFINPYTFGRALSIASGKKINLKDLVASEVGFDKIINIFEDANLRSKGKVLLKTS